MEYKYYKIDGKFLPVAIMNGVNYFPLRWVFENILGKSKIILYKKEIQDKIKEIKIIYDNRKTGGQISKCLSEKDMVNTIINFGRINKIPLSKIYALEKFIDVLNESQEKEEIRKILNKRKEELLGNNSSVDVYEIYQKFLTEKNKFPKILKYKPNLLKLLKELHKRKEINIDSCDFQTLLKSKHIPLGIVQANEVYEYLYGEDYLLFAYKFKNVEFKSRSKIDAFKMFSNYLNENSINMEELYTKPLYPIFRDCKLTKFIEKNYNGCQSQFLVEYFDYKGEIFKCRLMKNAGKNYWSKKENRIRELKLFIKDMGLTEDEIPLYLSNNYLAKHSRSLRMVLNKYYDDNIYKYVNEAYPNKFKEEMFYLSSLKNDFDSKDEFEIDHYLRKKFNNVIYNKRNSDNTVKIDDMIPDWVIIDNGSVIIVEYFGLYVPSQIKSKRVKDYIKRADEKIQKYIRSPYKCLFIFPEDLKNKYVLLEQKINKLQLKSE